MVFYFYPNEAIHQREIVTDDWMISAGSYQLEYSYIILLLIFLKVATYKCKHRLLCSYSVSEVNNLCQLIATCAYCDVIEKFYINYSRTDARCLVCCSARRAYNKGASYSSYIAMTGVSAITSVSNSISLATLIKWLRCCREWTIAGHGYITVPDIATLT